MKTQQKKLYKNYVNTHFSHLHNPNDILKEYEFYYRYYEKNYDHFLPTDINTSILDIGCGMGHFLFYLKKRGFNNYTGIDLSRECVDFCINQNLGRKENIYNVDVFDYLKSKKNKYDLIIMNDIIEHFQPEQIIPLLSLIKRHLNKDGKLVIKVVNSANPILGSSSRFIDFTHTLGFTEESLIQVLSITGFKKVKVYPQNIWIFNPIINLIGFFLQSIFNVIFRLMFLLYGRKTTKIFTKDIIAIGTK